MIDNTTLAAQSLLDHHPSEAAFNELREEIEAFPLDKLIHINLDILSTITTVLGALPGIIALRPEIEAEWRRFDLQRFDKLGKYTLALNHTHTRWRMASAPKSEVTERAADIEATRDRLLVDGHSLASHGLIASEPLKKCKSELGYRPMASDVLLLVNLIKSDWEKVENKTPLTLADLNAAATQALEFLAAVGEKDISPPPVGEATVTRQKAYTLFRLAYDDARRAALYLRDEDEANEIAPSLFAGRGGRPAPRPTQPVQPAEGATPGDPNLQPAAPVQPAQPGGMSPATPSLGDGSLAQIRVDHSAGVPQLTNPIQN